MNRAASILIALFSAAILLPGRLIADEPAFFRSLPYVPGTAIELDCRMAKVNVLGSDGETVDISVKGQPEPAVTAGESLLTISLPEGGLLRRGPEISLSIPRVAAVSADIGAGNIAFVGMSGKTEAEVSAGDISLDRMSGGVAARTGAGNIRASWRSGETLPGQCRLSTGIGNITLRLPDDAQARIAAETGLGSITGVSGGPDGVPRRQVSGEGDSQFSLSTGIGDIRVSRGQAEDEPVFRGRWDGRKRRPAGVGSGIGGGLIVSWPDRSYRDFNSATHPFGFPPVKKENHGWGGEGYLQLSRFRIGGMGWGSQWEARSSASDTLRFVDYECSYGGITLEYVVLSSPRADLSLGAMLGGGEARIRLARARDADVSWSEAAGLEDYREVNVLASGFAGMPMARLKVRLWKWLSLQAHAGYLYCRSTDWRYREDHDLFDSPRLDGSGWVFAVGPHLGI